MRNGRCLPLLASLVAVLAFADASGRASGDSWPANVRVNQDHVGNHQAETSIAVDPRDPLHLVAVFWEVISYDRQAPGMREKRLNWAWSRDGGRTWGSRRFENDVYSSDPSIVADRQGNFYIETILVPHFPDQTDASIGILKSTDGGETFVKTADVGLGRFMDKPHVTIDPATDALYMETTTSRRPRGTGCTRSGRMPAWATTTSLMQSVNLDDFDADGVLNDGDLDGQYADHRCTDGATAHCDDNCPGTRRTQRRPTSTETWWVTRATIARQCRTRTIAAEGHQSVAIEPGGEQMRSVVAVFACALVGLAASLHPAPQPESTAALDEIVAAD